MKMASDRSSSAGHPTPAAAPDHVRIPEDALRVIHHEAGHGYPEEICGILIGRDSDAGRVIERVVPVDNARADERSRRYIIEADVLRRVEHEAKRDGFEVIGFYHSHPDHAAIPSAYDREHSWPWYTYVIVAVRRGEIADVRAWRLTDDRTAFGEQSVISTEKTRDQPQQPVPETRQSPL
jgi:proteasome lid subunit RPN8/RPN11